MAATVPNHDLDGFIKSMAEGVHGAFKKGVKYGRYLEQQEKHAQDGRWEIFEEITTAYHGKQYYFMQPGGLIYSRDSGKYMSLEEAVEEFCRRFDDE